MRNWSLAFSFIGISVLGCGGADSGGDGPGGKGDGLDDSCADTRLDEGGVCRNASGEFAPAECCAVRTVACTLKRLATIPGGTPEVTATLTDADEEWADSDSLAAFDGSYGFVIEVYEDELNVVFDESAHVQDEVGSFTCDIARDGSDFCIEPIDVDKNLGSEDDPVYVHAFDFSCQWSETGAGTGEITCSLERLATIPGGSPEIVAVVEVGEYEYAYPDDSLEAFDGSYSFGIEVYDGVELSVVFDESAHVEDEVGSFSCDIEATSERFCVEPIEVDKQLGTENDPEYVHAFDFFCELQPAS